MCPDGELRCCHLVFGVFRPKIHVFWGPCFRSSENEGYKCRHHFRKFVNNVVIIIEILWKPRKMNLFCVFLCGIFFCFPTQNLSGDICQKNAALELANFGPQSIVCNIHPHICHHPVLDFNTEITRKYSTAMCYQTATKLLTIRGGCKDRTSDIQIGHMLWRTLYKIRHKNWL